MTVGVAWEQLCSQAGEDALRRLINDSPEEFFGDLARRNVHWYDQGSGQWLSFNLTERCWSGFDANSGDGIDRGALAEQDNPWSTVLDDSMSPYLRWFVGAETNAAFNELDRHILQGRGERTALIFEGDRWDPSKNGGRGGPVTEQHFSYRELLFETA
ncbi:MAG: acetyl-coenzyme A synthetase N-terminal domain-containing protein, partial [Luminiphilus sp.]